MTKSRILALISGFALLLTLPAVASAHPVPPHVFIGTVTVNGNPAPEGTELVALVGDKRRGTITIGSNGEYDPLLVKPGSERHITFRVGVLTAAETVAWERGGADVLDLTASRSQDVASQTEESQR